jgi:hypothetical protein
MLARTKRQRNMAISECNNRKLEVDMLKSAARAFEVSGVGSLGQPWPEGAKAPGSPLAARFQAAARCCTPPPRGVRFVSSGVAGGCGGGDGVVVGAKVQKNERHLPWNTPSPSQQHTNTTNTTTTTTPTPVPPAPPPRPPPAPPEAP